MENSRVEEGLKQIGLAALEIAHGCSMVVEIGPDVESVGLCVAALREMLATAERLLESMTIDKKLDHDGDTQPANEAPEPPPIVGGDLKGISFGPMAFEWTAPAEPAAEPTGPVSGFVERYDAEPPWMRDTTPCECRHERDVHGPGFVDSVTSEAAPLVCHVVDCSCKAFKPWNQGC